MVERGKLRRSSIALLGAMTLALSGAPIGRAAAPDDRLFDYFNQKYRVSLGDSRGACSYRIDPTDVYRFRNLRFTSTLISRGASGTACAGVAEFRPLQIDCQTLTIYELRLEDDGADPRSRTWKRNPLTLYGQVNNDFRDVTRESAQKVCALTPRPQPSRSTQPRSTAPAETLQK